MSENPTLNVRLTNPGPEGLPIIMTGTSDEVVTQLRLLWNQYRASETCDCGKVHFFETNEQMIDEMLAAHAKYNNILLGGYPTNHDRSAIAFLEVLQLAKQLTISGEGYKSAFSHVSLPSTVGMLINQMLQRA